MKNLIMSKETIRVCFSCKRALPFTPEHFYRSNTRYLQRECKPCNKRRRAAWWKSSLGKRSSANTKLKARFGITVEQFEAKLKEQDGKCLICGATQSVLGHKLAVDHNHTTGKIRGILCKSCNIGIGNLKDSPILLRQAADYLERYKGD